VLDTRDAERFVGPGGTVTVDLSAWTPATATAVVLNVTGINPSTNTYVTVHPSNEPRPNASNLNLAPNKTRANAVTVALSPDRRVTLYNHVGFTHLAVDLAGYYATDQGAGFTPQAPERMLDTRSGAPVGPRGVVDVDLRLPSWDRPTAVVLNVTAVQATTNTFVTAYTAGQPVPLASSLNTGPHETVPNQVTVPLDLGRKVSLLNGNGSVHLIVDVVGYYHSGSGSDFVAITPLRRLDTRPGNGLYPETVGISITGWGPDVRAVAANVTGANATHPQHIVVWPGDRPRPDTSSLNLEPSQTVANAVAVGVGYDAMREDYSVSIVNNAGYADVIFDVAGYFIDHA
jgi:hypothetical protein